MKMRRNKFVPINSLKKTKVQFSTRLSGCLGEHQCQEFFERVNITRQSGICSKNKNNSFGDKRSNSFRQTLQLNVPFVADFSESKQFCICYPVHFFRKKLHSYDPEDNRLASIRVYFPASRMKSGNDFKVSLDLKKRIHLYPFQFEFVGYSSLLTLSIEDLSLAVFRAKSSSEKFKIVSSLSIPKFLISQTVSNSQTGTPIFIATERIYSRVLKLISCSQSNAFKLKNDSIMNSDSNIYLKKCLLKWIGLEDFLPPTSRIIFVRRVSSDSGETLGTSILNSPGPKIKRSRAKERSSILTKQIKSESLEDCLEEPKDVTSPDDPLSTVIKITNCDNQDNKRPRGRPKKQLNISTINIEINFTDEERVSPKKDETGQTVADGIKRDSIQLKSESTSNNSMTDSTSEEKYSVQLSSCTTPDTNTSCSPVLLNGTVTTALSSTSSTVQSSTQITNCNTVKNKRGRPRKYPMSVNAERKLFKNHKEAVDDQGTITHSEDWLMRNRKRSCTDSITESKNKMFKSSNSSISSNDGNLLKESPADLFGINGNIKLDFVGHSIWTPLKEPLPAPDPPVPFTKELSNTGLVTDRKLKSCPNSLNVAYRPKTPSKALPEHGSQKLIFDSLTSADNLNKIFHNVSSHEPNSGKSIFGKDPGFNLSNNSQYMFPTSGYNPLMMPQMNYNNNLLMPLINNIFHSNPVSAPPLINNLGSLFSSVNSSNAIKPSLTPFYDNSCRQGFPNSQFLANDNVLSSSISHNPQQLQFNHQILAGKFDYSSPWHNYDYQWKY